MKQHFAGMLKDKKGITLVELLISLGILGILVLAAFNIYDFGNRSYAEESSKISSNDSLRQGMDIVLTEIRKSGAGIDDFNADETNGIYKFMGDTGDEGHEVIITFSDHNLYISTDGNSIKLFGDLYDFQCYKLGGQIKIIMTGSYMDKSGRRNELISYYYFR